MLSRLRTIADDVRRDLADNGGVDGRFDARTVGVLLLTSVLLTLFYYYARPGFYHRHLDDTVLGALGLADSPFEGVVAYWYWAFAAVLLRVVVPLVAILAWFRESPRDYGFRMWERGHGWPYLLLYLVMLPVLVGVSFTESFQGKYPFYDAAGESWLHFALYEPTYLLQFVALEAFFRGFLVFALFKRFGYHGVVIMTVPYCMIHFGKPAPEAIGAILAGLLLGYMALKSKSWIPGALLHWGVGITMDLLCILQTRG